jgi:hypothetical protein
MLALSQAETFAFVLNRGAAIALEDCGVTVNSNGAPAAVFNREATLETQRLCVPNRMIAENGGIFTKPVKVCKDSRDFMAGTYTLPKAGPCIRGSTNYKAGPHVLKPGVYCGWQYFEPGSRVKLLPGTYVVRRGGFIIGGDTFSARRVSIHLADRSIIQFDPGVRALMTAPLSGPQMGYVITEAQHSRAGLKPSWIAINAVKRLRIIGRIHLPTRDIVFNRDSRMMASRFAIIANRLHFNESRIVARPD